MVYVLIQGVGETKSTLTRKDRLCLVCKSSQHVEGEHHFVLYCLLYSHVRARHASLFQQTSSVSDFFARCEPNACGGFIRSCFSHRSGILNK